MGKTRRIKRKGAKDQKRKEERKKKRRKGMCEHNIEGAKSPVNIGKEVQRNHGCCQNKADSGTPPTPRAHGDKRHSLLPRHIMGSPCRNRHRGALVQPAHAAHKKAHAATDAQAHIGTRDMEATAQVQLDIRCMRVQRVCVPLKMQTPSPGSVASSQTREGTKVPGKTQCNIEERKWERERHHSYHHECCCFAPQCVGGYHSQIGCEEQSA